MKVVIVAPSLDVDKNVSGISAVANYIIENNKDVEYLHFEIGKRDNEKKGIKRIMKLLIQLIKWTKLIRTYKDIIIHYNFPLSKASIIRDPIFMFIARIMKVKMLVHIHGGFYLTADKYPFIIRLILLKVFSWNVPFVVLSEDEKNILIKKFKVTNVTCLPNSVDLKDASIFVRNYTKNTIRIGYLGRIAESKGMDYLLEACKCLKNEKINFILDIAGKEEFTDQYIPIFKKELKENFHYSGVVSGNYKNNYLRNLDIFVLPSYFEGLPMSLLECMSYGCVPITTPVGSIPGIVKDGINGLFIKVKDSYSIVSAIISMYNRPEFMKYLGNNARKTIFDGFSSQKYMEKLNKIYVSL